VELERDFLKDFIEILPIPHALPRAIEAKLVSSVDLMSPSLDIGCGDGSFASVLLRSSRKAFDVGLDISANELSRARRIVDYKSLTLSDVLALPFADQSFRMILCNSVLEHISQLDQALLEISRVLSGQGQFVCTVPLRSNSKYFFYSKLLRSLGFRGLAERYSTMKHNLWQHYHLLTQEEWCSKLEMVGLNVKTVKEFLGEPVFSFCDLIAPFNLVNLLMKRRFNRTFIFRPAWFSSFLSNFLDRYYQDDYLPGGSLFIIAVKNESY
jgi:ubiquinone/menaquinone biosynthesis C-methylase UbiE